MGKYFSNNVSLSVLAKQLLFKQLKAPPAFEICILSGVFSSYTSPRSARVIINLFHLFVNFQASEC